MFDITVWATVLGIINTVVSMIACPIIAVAQQKTYLNKDIYGRRFLNH